jgi:predicted nucleic acid-binding protein
MRLAEPLLVDTNILLEATDEARTHHAEARILLEATRRLVCSAQVIREYLAVATRAVSVNGLGMATDEALDNVRQFRRRVRLLPEEKPVLAAFLEVVERAHPAGKRIHDAHLIATALVHGVPTVVSLNRPDLAGLDPRIAIVTPVEALRPQPGRRQPRS